MSEVKIVHCFVLDSSDAICVDNDVMVVEKVEGSDDVVKFVI